MSGDIYEQAVVKPIPFGSGIWEIFWGDLGTSYKIIGRA